VKKSGTVNISMDNPISQTDFFQLVYQVVEFIPVGRATSYGAIAKYLGATKSSRMVGWAMNAAHKYPDIPAHRVVNRNGCLTGKMHFGDPNRMQRLLEAEGVLVHEDQIQNWKYVFWDPNVELTIT
jgi:methylated-DNA-protein-cysteine methyltransferase-like protein